MVNTYRVRFSESLVGHVKLTRLLNFFLRWSKQLRETVDRGMVSR